MAKLEPATTELRDTGIGIIGYAPWGTHFCHFYETKEDLADLLVPYFKAGLENNEFCMWVTSQPLGVADAKSALRRALPQLDKYIKNQQIEILDYGDWYTKEGKFDADRVLEGWVEKARSAVEKGFDGLRLTGNTFWLEDRDWKSFADYEAAVNNVIGQHPMIALCSYALQRCGPHEFMDVVHNHQFALVKREGHWEILASAALGQARQALLEERTRGEERVTGILESLTDGFVSIDRDWRYTFINAAAERILGRQREELLGRDMRSEYSDPTAVRIQRHCQRAMSQQKPVTLEEYYAPLGVWVEIRAYPWADGLSIFFRDITERERAGETLRYHAALLDGLNDAVIATDNQWTITAWNPAAEALFGWKAEEVLGRPTAETLTRIERDGRPFLREESRRALADTGRFRAELTYYRRNGTPVEVESSAVAIHDDQGRPIGYVTVLRDITERKRAEEALQNLASLPGENPSPVMRVSADGTLIYANESSRPLLELWRCAVGSSLPPEPYQQVESAFAAGEPVIGETVCGDRTILVIYAPIAGRDYVNIYGLDITERKQAEQALRQTRDYLENLIDHANAPIIVWDPSFIITRFNGAFERLTGRPAAEVLGQRLDVLFPEPERAASMEKIARTVRGEHWELIEIPILHESGEVRQVLWNSANITGGDGQTVVATIAQGTDITDRKQAEDALRQTRDYLEKLIDYANAPIIVWDPSFTITRFNGAFERLTGRPANEVVGQRLEVLFPGEERAASMEKIARTVRGEHWELIEIPILHRSGDVRQVLWNSANITDGDGQTVVATIAQGTDITERKLAEEALRESRKDLDRAQAVAHIGNWRLDTRSNELLWSDETYRIFGIPQGTPMTYEAFLAAVHPEDRDYVEQEWTAALRGEPYDIEHRILVDDNVRWVREQAELELDKDGTLVGGFGTAQDITELKRAEEALERLRTEFMGMVTHELRTPLTAIKGSAATALGSRRPLAAEENRELFEIIDEQADRLRELMDDLLDVTRIEAGTLSVRPEPTDLLEVLEEARATFVRSGGRHEILLQSPADMPAVQADRRRVVQVLMNLVNNAAMFSSPTEPITIAAEHSSMQVTVHVRDRGRGIPKEKLPLLFKKFSRLHDDAGQRLSGTGLGLAICKGIVEAHGGRIWVESAGECEGSTFSFTLPLAVGVSVKAASDEAQRAAHPGRVRRPTEKTRVLAVDDEPQILRYLRRCLDDAGYQPIVTADPCEVAKLVELEEPDLVLLDLMLPGTSGFELLKNIREFSGVPVIFLTASDKEEDAVRALKSGADDYITKPFSPSELLARIGAALRRRVLPDTMEARAPFALGDLVINFAERRVTVCGQEVSLSATEYKILHELATHAGRPTTYEQILHEVWGPEYSGETELVRSFIRNLRRKLGDDAQDPRFILTERQVGYRMPKP
jgi:PAS domain S-box-containing protein